MHTKDETEVVILRVDPDILCLDIKYAILDDWSLCDVPTQDDYITIIRGTLYQGELAKFPQGALAASGELQYFNYADLECRAGFVFYKLKRPNRDWVELVVSEGNCLTDFDMGYRTDA